MSTGYVLMECGHWTTCNGVSTSYVKGQYIRCIRDVEPNDADNTTGMTMVVAVFLPGPTLWMEKA